MRIGNRRLGTGRSTRVHVMDVLEARRLLSATLVADINPAGSSLPRGTAQQSVALGNVMLFGATEPTSGTELWRTDGTPAGTSRVLDINTSVNPTTGAALSSDPRLFVAGEPGVAYFTATTPDFGRELWRTDGTAAGTQRITDLNPGNKDTFTTGSLLFHQGRSTSWPSARPACPASGRATAPPVAPSC